MKIKLEITSQYNINRGKVALTSQVERQIAQYIIDNEEVEVNRLKNKINRLESQLRALPNLVNSAKLLLQSFTKKEE